MQDQEIRHQPSCEDELNIGLLTVAEAQARILEGITQVHRLQGFRMKQAAVLQGHLLQARDASLAAAETVTQGEVTRRLSGQPAAFRGGIVADNEAGLAPLLGLQPQALTGEAGAAAVAQAVQRQWNTTHGLAVLCDGDEKTWVAVAGEQGVAIRAGHHCAQPLLNRMGLAATARASFAVHSDVDDIEALVRALQLARHLLGGVGYGRDSTAVGAGPSPRVPPFPAHAGRERDGGAAAHQPRTRAARAPRHRRAESRTFATPTPGSRPHDRQHPQGPDHRDRTPRHRRTESRALATPNVPTK